MNKDEIYIILENAKKQIEIYTKKKSCNPNWTPFYNGVIEGLDSIINSYVINTTISLQEEDKELKI